MFLGGFMRLYNPNYENYVKKYAKRDKTLRTIGKLLTALLILAAIGLLVYLIIIKAMWYFYLADIGGGLILVWLTWIFIPSGQLEYIDFDDKLSKSENRSEIDIDMLKTQYPDTKVIVKASDDIVRGVWMGKFEQRGLFGGIAVCDDCGEAYDPKNITYDAAMGASSRSSTESGNIYYSQKVSFKVYCKCSKCGKEKTSTFDKVFDTGSTVYKHELFSDRTTVINTSSNVDCDKFIADVYEQDLKRYAADKTQYENFLLKKAKEINWKRDQDRARQEERIASLRAKGWYEKEDNSREGSKPVDADASGKIAE